MRRHLRSALRVTNLKNTFPMKFTIAGIAAAVFTILSSPQAVAQKIRLYNSEQGLPNSQINAVYQDTRGYMWVSTENGVAYFDGMRFTSFYHDRTRAGSLSGGNVSMVFNDSRGTCWVGTSNGLQQFDPALNTFRQFEFPDMVSDRWNFFVTSIAESPDNRFILVSCSGRGLFVLDTDTYEYNADLTETLNGLFSTSYTGSLYFDRQGRLWASPEQGGLMVVEPGMNRQVTDIWEPSLESIRSEIVVSAIVGDEPSGNLIIGTFNHGILVYDTATGRIRRARGASSAGIRVRALHTCSMANAYGTGRCVWVGTEDMGLRLFNVGSEEVGATRLTHCPIDINRCKAHSIIEDSQGNVWVGVYQKGLLVIPKSSYGFDYFVFNDPASAMPDRNVACVTSVVRDRDGNLWAGTDGGGLFRIRRDGQTDNYTAANSSLPNNSIMALATDSRGTLWISSYMGGITTYTARDGFRKFASDGDLQKVICFEYDPKDDLMYAGTYGNGVSVIHCPSGTVERFPDRTIAGWVSSLMLDGGGRLWVGRADGTRCYDLHTREEVALDIGDIASFSRTYSFSTGGDGRLWIGTAEGLVAYDPALDTHRHYTVGDGLAANMVCSILPGGDGNLWISTANGLSRLDTAVGEFKNFYAYDGLQDNEFRFGAAYTDTDGRMFFGGIGGLSAFYPAAVDQKEHPMPKINFTGFSVFNELVKYDPDLGGENILDRHITQATRATLKNSDNVFSIEFTVLEYTNPQKIVYGYMMEGFDTDWNYTTAGHRQATYTNLPHGRYRFRVQAFFEGNRREDVVYNQLEIRILPPWYKTWWAYLVYLAIAGALGWLVYDFIRRRRQGELERTELEKKETKLRMFTDLSHEIRTPLTLVMTPLKRIREAETDGRNREIYNLMYRNLLRILRIINQLLDMRKIDNNQLRMKFNRTDIVFFIRDIMRSFDHMAMLHNIDFRLITNHESLDVWVDQGNFDKVLFNILSNAFKFTPDNGNVITSLVVSANGPESGITPRADEYLELRIENTGDNIEPGQLGRLFDRFFQLDKHAAGGSGIGLNLAKMIVQLHHGTIHAENIQGGVAFIIRIPVGYDHLSREEISADAKHKDLYYTVSPGTRSDQAEEMMELAGDDELKTSKKKRNIILVDDDPELGNYLRIELAAHYNIQTCKNGRDAWKIISTSIPDAVVTDLMMPECDGYELCRKIKQSPDTNHIPVIILTSMTDEDTEQRCMDSGADRYLKKPISLDLLKGAISQAIATRDTMRKKFGTEINPGYEEVQMSSPDSRFITRVIESIRKNIENPEFSVDDLSRDVGISRVHLNRKLKENINISPSNLIKSIRLKQAAYLLINHKVNISEVAYKVGFSTHSYFSNSFKDYFGMAPKEFVVKYMDTDDKEAMRRMFE